MQRFALCGFALLLISAASAAGTPQRPSDLWIVGVDRATILCGGTVVATREKGDLIAVSGCSGNWLQVRHGGGTGWVCRRDVVPLHNAVSYFSKVICRNPKDSKAYLARAVAHQQCNAIDLAMTDYDRAIQLNPLSVKAHWGRGQARWAVGLRDHAREDFRTAADLDPTLPVLPRLVEEVYGRAELVSRRYNDPAVAKASWAVPTVWGCTGTMIGPNLLMTAAHCGATDRGMTFVVYRDSHDSPISPYLMSGSTTSNSEWFQCRILLSSFHRSDLALYYCEPSAAGENPGDKYGYLDLQVARPVPGQDVYSIIAHPLESLGLNDARIWTKGTVLSDSVVIWPPPCPNDPNPGGPITTPIGIGMDIFGDLGVSGSSTLNPRNHRIWIGPTSTVGHWKKNALSMGHYLELATAEGTIVGEVHQPGVFAENLTNLGLTAADYTGRVDRDNNHLFDVQEDLERLRGENARDWYHLGFESPRRNALWDKTNVVFSTIPAIADIKVPSTTGLTEVLRHARLNLLPNKTYRISVRLKAFSSPSRRNLKIQLIRRRDSLVTIDDEATLLTLPGSGWKVVSARLRTRGPAAELVIAVPQGGFRAQLSSLTVAEDRAEMNFDSHDKRSSWRDANDDLAPTILPDGADPNRADWAGFVYRRNWLPAASDWSLANRQLGMVAGQSYQIFFDVKANTLAPHDAQNWGVVRVVDGDSVVMQKRFRPSPGWRTIVTRVFTPPSSDTDVQFGNQASTAPLDLVVPSYFVDNIRIERILSPIDPHQAK